MLSPFASLAPHTRSRLSALGVNGIALSALVLVATCSGEDEETRLHRELTEAQSATAFCDQAPGNCTVDELAKRNVALSAAELNITKFQQRD